MTVAAGRKRAKITIQTLTESVGARGGIAMTPSTFATVWAEWAPSSAGERFTGAAEQSVGSGQFRCNYLSGVSTKMRVNWASASRTFDVVGVENEAGRNFRTIITVQEIQA